MKKHTLNELKLEIQVNAKNGIDFILSAGIVWSLIAYVWTFEFTSYEKSVITLMVGAILLPMAYGFSKIFKTNWKVKDNPLQPLGLWLNFAQLIYFPFLIFILIKYPDYFIMTYAIITGAHLFPYAWFYDEIGYAIWAIFISLGSLILMLNVEPKMTWTVPLFTAILFFLFAIWIYIRINRRIIHKN